MNSEQDEAKMLSRIIVISIGVAYIACWTMAFVAVSYTPVN